LAASGAGFVGSTGVVGCVPGTVAVGAFEGCFLAAPEHELEHAVVAVNTSAQRAGEFRSDDKLAIPDRSNARQA